MSEKNYTPDLLFEVSWEVCNKVGGIHTVVATKALTVTSLIGDNYIVIGPDFTNEGVSPEFEEDANLMKAWRQALYENGIRIRIGRWKIPGKPVAILIDFTTLFSSKDDILKKLWEDYRVDSLNGQWDYIEPVLFGYLAGEVIKSYVENFVVAKQNVVAHFHEWMTCSGGLYLRKYFPSVATVMTTHATVMGRCIAGNGLSLYGDLSKFDSEELSHRFNVAAKHTIEKAGAENHDIFLTVSDITARECKYLLNKVPDFVTPNGFENDFVWKGEEYTQKRLEARHLMIDVAEACLGYKFSTEPLIIGTSGRYEFHNKGLDVFMNALKKVAHANPAREILAYVTVPSASRGARTDLQNYLQDRNSPIDFSQYRYSTHYLDNIEWDPICRSIHGSVLEDPSSRVKVIFVPTYLNKADGIFNKNYYELLIGMDLTVFPSYYEPWGYTPLESIAFNVPTITSSLAGFGVWARSLDKNSGIYVIERNDTNQGEAENAVCNCINNFINFSEKEVSEMRQNVYEISKKALWCNMFSYYKKAYEAAIETSISRTNRIIMGDGGNVNEQVNFVRQQLVVERPNWQRVIVEKQLPKSLQLLEELSKNLWWCWNTNARDLFENIDPALWEAVEQNPIALLDKLSVEKLQALENDKEFLSKLNEIYAEFQEYVNEKPDPKVPKIAYFSMEYGLHHSLKIYSGGLGILAGDYLKEASDKNVPMVAVGLLYRYGYFTQRLSAQGEQEAAYEAQNFHKLPISPVRDETGSWVTVSIAFPGRTLSARVWLCNVGRTKLYLLDTDYEANIDEDRTITHHLYGGDWENRLKQEMLLGVGGIRALVQMGIKQDVYHCNEGHAAFIGVERIRNLIHRQKLSFSEALEVIRSSSLFTTHTPVPAGHDAFPESMIRQYMSHYPDVLGITWEQYINLGKVNPYDPNERFSMSVLACNLSQEVNGVSWLHGEVSKDILGNMWPGYYKNELHIGYVTNGVHFPTWTSRILKKLYSKYFADGFNGHQYNIEKWQGAYNIPDEELWNAKIQLKRKLVATIRKRYQDPSQVRFDSPSQMLKVIGNMKPEVLTIGFARRFATYKRAYLLFTNLERLSAIVNNKERPVQFIFAGKAHPNDKPGQDLIKRIVEVSHRPEFVGKIIFLQNYDMELARRMVQGVDIWLNTPTRPLEASGTSGEKAVMNGTMQFSVLDGWWVEGYKEGAGWSLPLEQTFADKSHQDELDAEMIYSTIEQEIVPKYYSRNDMNVPKEWVASVKKCIAEIASNFTTNRMITDYEERFYNKLADRKKTLINDNYRLAREIAAWKRKVSAAWDHLYVVDVQRTRIDSESIYVGEKYKFEVTVNLAGLDANDIGVELVVAKPTIAGESVNVSYKVDMNMVETDGNVAKFALDFVPKKTGMFDVAMRIYPKNENLPYRMDFALVKWA